MTDQPKDKEVAIREMQVHQTDDGRRIETYTINGTTKCVIPPNANPEDLNMDFDESETVYIGAIHLMSPTGPREIKFSILDVDSLEEAFDKYYEYADKAVEEIKRRAQEEQGQQIVQAPADALNAIDGMAQDGTGGIIV
jgi:hypothetical protein